VGIAGSGHLRQGFGIAYQLHDLGVTRIATLLPIDVPADCEALRTGFADAVFALARPSAVPPPRPRLGVRLEQKDKTVTIVGVTQGSLAASMGLRAGDVIVRMAGVPVTGLASVIAPIRAQPPGTWLPMRLQRGAEMLDLVIKFPPAKPK
jgi:S1-C subfamily serine protease